MTAPGGGPAHTGRLAWTALLPMAIGYIAVQVVCVAAVLAFPAQRRADMEVRLP
jgi:hypothetical protein